MKILKIEIQNINSLKCDEPIVIDFETNKFKDVGLYAITGSTGAGKTTILDAITLALYHKVPRLNNSTTKVKNVVSFGAISAKTIVLFENNNETYEATWTIKMRTVQGVLLKTPIEEVRLKNFSTGLIIAEKKKEVQVKITEIIQLDYDQFLRSVMLAQGDFASFLSAKGVDKAKLLEQITGEKIYKKIGEAILQKIRDAKFNLKEIYAKLNNDDILSDEEKESLTIKKSELKGDLKELNNQQIQNEKIVNWFIKHDEILDKKAVLNEQIEGLKSKENKNKNLLDKLSLHKKALPFKESIKEIQRLEREIKTKQNSVNKLVFELTELVPKITIQTKKNKSIEISLKESENIFNSWLPKLEIISKLDANIKASNSSKNDLALQLVEFNVINNKLITEKAKKVKALNSNKDEINSVKAYLSLNKTTPELEKNHSSWNNKLSIISRNFKTINDEETKLAYLLKSKINLEKNLLKLQGEEKKNDGILSDEEGKLIEITTFLEQNDLDELQKKLATTSITGTKWSSLEKLSTEYTTKLKKRSKSQLVLKKFNVDNKKLKLKIDVLIKEIKIAKVNFDDYEIIHLQNLKIKSLEDEREFLEKGKPCTLCGSEEHPLIEKYSKIATSDSEGILQKRKNILEVLNDKLQSDNLSFATTDTKIKGEQTIIENLKKELNTLKRQSSLLKLEVKIENIVFIKSALEKTRSDYKKYDEKIKVANAKTKAKIILVTELTTKTAEQNKVKEAIAVHQEKLKNSTNDIEKLKELISKYKNEILLIEDELKPQFEKNSLSMPEIKDSTIFINDIKEKISNFNSKSTNLITLNGNQSILETEINNTSKDLAEKSNDIIKLETKIKLINTTINDLIFKRVKILDKEISVEQKRISITKSKEFAKSNNAKSVSVLLELTDRNRELTTNKNTTSLDLKTQVVALKNEQSVLTTDLKESYFGSINEIAKVLLTEDIFFEIKKIKKEIDTEKIAIETAKKIIQLDEKTLVKQKDFEISFEEVKNSVKTNRITIAKTSKHLGQISERMKKNKEILERNNTTQKKIEGQEKIVRKWSTLMEIIGGSKDAFNNYVQRLTLQHLISLANVHLQKLNKRYSLKIKKGDINKSDFLNFNLIDHFQANETRDVDTSSGGEKFLISLSLALGLSDLASKNVQINSLFIDEGFGSLDSNTLETVISALETLQDQGKIIGVISHVESLKERISTQIQVVKKSNGVSTVEIV